MKKTVFIDTNIIISGTFFKGNESKLLSALQIDLLTSDTVIKELYEVVRIKFKSLKIGIQRIAYNEIRNSLKNISDIVSRRKYSKFLPVAEKILKFKDDIEILSAVLYSKPDYFVTGDKHFHKKEVKKLVKVRYTRQILKELEII